MVKQEKWIIRYIVTNNAGKESEKRVYPDSIDKKNELLAKCKQYGYKVKACNKLYPFSTAKNQHNFELINNRCFNEMYDMMHGEKPYNNAEYLRLEGLREKAQKYFCYPLPVAWVTWEELQEMRELSSIAILDRQEKCIAAGRADLVPYCVT